MNLSAISVGRVLSRGVPLPPTCALGKLIQLFGDPMGPLLGELNEVIVP
jgi:hypothetical protein